MKTLLLYLLILIPIFSWTSVNAQWLEGTNIITFEPNDSVLNHKVSIDTVHYPHNKWQIGAPHKPIFDSASSLSNVIVTDTLYPYCPNDTSVFTIHFPKQIINSIGNRFMPKFLFFHYRLDTDATTQLNLDFSDDSGTTWIPLRWTIYEYPGICLHSDFFNIPWLIIHYDTFHADAQFRFTFIADNDTMGKEGWMIDDINIDYGFPESVKELNNEWGINIFPNPTHTSFTIASPKPINHVTIKNIFGQCVYSQLCSTNKIEIDIANLQNGLYFVEVANSETGKRVVRKVLKE